MTQTLAERHQLQPAGIPVISGTLATSKKTMDYIPKDHNDTAIPAIMNCFVKEAKNTKYIAKMVTSRDVQYAKDLSKCLGKNQRGNFILCKIKFILINTDYTDIAFIGTPKEIILNTSLGLYEKYYILMSVPRRYFLHFHIPPYYFSTRFQKYKLRRY